MMEIDGKKKRFVVNSNADHFLRLTRTGGTKVLILECPTKTLEESLQNVVGKSLFIITK